MKKQVRALLDMPHHVSKRHRQMPGKERAAQFAPFAALSGYAEAIDQAALVPEAPWEPDEEQIAALDKAMQRLQELPAEKRRVQICRLEEDKKAGTRYVNMTALVRHIDTADRILTLEYGEVLGLDDICSIHVLDGTEQPEEQEAP